MVKSWQELGEAIADFENRLSWCENMLTPSDASLNHSQEALEPQISQAQPKEVESIPEYLEGVHRQLAQIMAVQRYLLNKVKELEAKKKWNTEGIF